MWSVRLAKTRSQSVDAIANGKVRLNDDHAKPAKEVKLGDEIQIIRHSAKFTFKVIQLLHNRVGAKLVQDYIIDITPEEEKEKLKLYRLSQNVYREHGTGKPSKQDRRNLDDFLENW